MLPQQVALHVTRLPLTGSSEAELTRMTEGLPDAARLLADARVDLIAFNCTAVSTRAPGEDAAIAERITDATGTKAVTTAEALVAALHHFAASRIVLVTPYIAPVTERETAFFEHHGFEVLHSAGYNIDANWDMAQEPPETWHNLVLANRRDAADAFVLSCTAIRSMEVIEGLEGALGRPVLSSNQALAWYAAQSCGQAVPVEGFGVLLHEPGSALNRARPDK